MLLGDLKLIIPHAECIDLHQYLRQLLTGKGGYNVRFGSKADICSAQADVCFTPNSNRESRHPQRVMSALPPIATAKADMSLASCPLFPRKQTCAVQDAMSALGQKRTSRAPSDFRRTERYEAE